MSYSERCSIVVDKQNKSASRIGSLTQLQWLAVVLVVVTGVLHVYAGLVEGRIPVTIAGVGYAGALVLFFFDYRRRLLYLLGIPYTAVQFPLWIVAKSEYGMIDYVDKAVQLVLILVFIYLYLNTSSDPAGNTATAAD
jgi:hypothetical protein